MKKILFFMLLSCIANCSFSQNILNGLFEIKLGMNEEQIREVVDVSLLSEDIDNVYSTGEGEDSWPMVKPLILDSYCILNPELCVEHIVLYLADDKLYMIKIFSQNKELENLLSQLYGAPTLEVSKGILDKKGREIVKKWNTNDREVVCKATFYPDANRHNLGSYNLTIANMMFVLPLLKEMIKNK